MTAQAWFLEGDLKQAQMFAKRAQAKLSLGTPEWLRTDDILNYKPADLISSRAQGSSCASAKGNRRFLRSSRACNCA